MSTMKFLSLRELRTATGEIKGILANNGKIIVTSNGKPTAFMVAINENSLEETLGDWKQVTALRALRNLQKQAKENGLSGMTLDDINAEITASRKEHKDKIAQSVSQLFRGKRRLC